MGPCMAAVTVIMGKRLKEQEFKIILGYIVSLRLALATIDFV